MQASVLIVVALGTSAPAGTAPAASSMVRPEWAAPLGGASGAECVDHSAAHSEKGGVQNNTRWTHWAVPSGDRPASGWPVIVTFEVGGFYPVAGSPHENDTCGDGWHQPWQPFGPPPSPVCSRVLEHACGALQSNYSACQRCVNRIPGEEREAANCTDYQPWMFCPRPPDLHSQRSPHGPFAPVPAIYNTSFFPNMSYNPRHDGFDDANAGELWLQRTRQYTLANGLAWLVLNPFEMGAWLCLVGVSAFCACSSDARA